MQTDIDVIGKDAGKFGGGDSRDDNVIFEFGGIHLELGHKATAYEKTDIFPHILPKDHAHELASFFSEFERDPTLIVRLFSSFYPLQVFLRDLGLYKSAVSFRFHSRCFLLLGLAHNAELERRCEIFSEEIGCCFRNNGEGKLWSPLFLADIKTPDILSHTLQPAFYDAHHSKRKQGKAAGILGIELQTVGRAHGAATTNEKGAQGKTDDETAKHVAESVWGKGKMEN